MQGLEPLRTRLENQRNLLRNLRDNSGLLTPAQYVVESRAAL
jgi:hypothetical protein